MASRIHLSKNRTNSSNRVQNYSGQTSRYFQSTEKVKLNKEHTESYDLPFSRTFINDSKSYFQFYQQELIKINKDLDTKEIAIRNSPSLTNSFETYYKYLESLALCVKNKDNNFASCLIRGLIGLSKSFKAKQFSFVKEEPKLQKPAKKLFRENMSQTFNNYDTAETEPDTYVEINFIKGLIERIGKLKVPKILQSLYDLYESLSKLNTEIPSPTKTPESEEVNIGNMNQKLKLSLNLMKTEIKKNLKKHNIGVLKTDKEIQTEKNKLGYFEDPVKEKELEVQNLKITIQHLNKEMDEVKENFLKIKEYCGHTETKHNELKIELIQTVNKLKQSENISKNFKQKLALMNEKINNKKKKIFEIRTKLNEFKSSLNSKILACQQAKNESFNLMVLQKVAEEKLKQLESI